MEKKKGIMKTIQKKKRGKRGRGGGTSVETFATSHGSA